MKRSLSRRSFLCALGCMAAACKGGGASKPSAAPLNLGPVAAFAEGATPFTIYRVQVVRQGPSFRAVSLLCTHQTCLVIPVTEGFDCPCHGSKFSAEGKRLSGPARLDLPWYRLSLSPEGDLLVHLDAHEPPSYRFILSA